MYAAESDIFSLGHSLTRTRQNARLANFRLFLAYFLYNVFGDDSSSAHLSE